jgi:glutaredoxin
MKAKIKIYTSKSCKYCDQVKELLKENWIEYVELEVGEHKESWDQVKKLTDLPIFPTIEIENEFLVPNRDFNSPTNLVDLIKNFDKSKFSDSKRTLELVKTLNYNIYTAFNRLNKVIEELENK